MLEKQYKICSNCGVRVFKTQANPDATCEYRHCRHGINDQSTSQTDEQFTSLCKKYIGMNVFIPDIGAPLRCIDIKYPNSLVCMSDWHPDQYVFKPDEFEYMLKNQSLLH